MAPMNMVGDFPYWQTGTPTYPTYIHPTNTFTPRLSDDDIERIAKRVAELISKKGRKK